MLMKLISRGYSCCMTKLSTVVLQGLADIILGPQPSFCLISNGAECVMINKEFYKEHCPQALIRKLLPMVKA